MIITQSYLQCQHVHQTGHFKMAGIIYLCSYYHVCKQGLLSPQCYRCLGQLVCCYSDCALQSILQYSLAETTKNVSRHDSNIIQVTKSPQIESHLSIAYPSAPEMNECITPLHFRTGGFDFTYPNLKDGLLSLSD